MKKFLFLLVLFVIAIFLSGCTDQSVCGDGVCSFLEQDSKSPYYCPMDCNLPPDSDCAKEGENFSKVFTDEYPSECCEGLTEWDSGMDTREVVDGICVETGAVSGYPVGTCINCGNGICEDIENICNCPEDCEGSTELDLDVQMVTSKTQFVIGEEVKLK